MLVDAGDTALSITIAISIRNRVSLQASCSLVSIFGSSVSHECMHEGILLGLAEKWIRPMFRMRKTEKKLMRVVRWLRWLVDTQCQLAMRAGESTGSISVLTEH